MCAPGPQTFFRWLPNGAKRRACAPELRVSNVETQKELLDAQTVRERMLATLAMFLAVVAITLAGVGLYGVLFYSVIQRPREIGICIALGAPPAHVIRSILSGISLALAMGTAAGLTLGLVSPRFDRVASLPSEGIRFRSLGGNSGNQRELTSIAGDHLLIVIDPHALGSAHPPTPAIGPGLPRSPYFCLSDRHA